MIGWYPENRTSGASATYAARQATASRTGAGAGETIAAAAKAGGNGAAAVGEYDFGSMTPSEMHDVADKLFKAGDIDLTQLFMLQNMGVPLGRMGASGELVPLTEAERDGFRSQPYDYFAGTKGAMAFLEQSGRTHDPKSGYQNWQGILDVLEKRQGAPAGLDITI